MKYALQRREVNTFVRNELRQNMTNLPERWVTRILANKISEIIQYIDQNHRIIDYNTDEIIINYSRF